MKMNKKENNTVIIMTPIVLPNKEMRLMIFETRYDMIGSIVSKYYESIRGFVKYVNKTIDVDGIEALPEYDLAPLFYEYLLTEAEQYTGHKRCSYIYSTIDADFRERLRLHKYSRPTISPGWYLNIYKEWEKDNTFRITEDMVSNMLYEMGVARFPLLIK